jgi:DNA-binding GntR family transcriptional regulator
MAFDGKIQRPKSLTDLAVERIRSTIIEGHFALGEQLSEVTLATTLGISKTPVREALFQLKLEGLVDVHPQRGTFVFDLTEEEVIDICAFRELIETAALAKAMANSKEKLLRELESVIEATDQAARDVNYKEIAVLDRRFHETIIACSNSANLKAAYKLIAYKIQALRARLPEQDTDVAHCNDNHRTLVEEIRNGTTLRAQKLLREHIRNTQDAYLSASANKLALTA